MSSVWLEFLPWLWETGKVWGCEGHPWWPQALGDGKANSRSPAMAMMTVIASVRVPGCLRYPGLEAVAEAKRRSVSFVMDVVAAMRSFCHQGLPRW